MVLVLARHPADPAADARGRDDEGRPARAVRRAHAAPRADRDHGPARSSASSRRRSTRPGSAPPGLSWPADPQWGNFVEAFKVANMSALLASSVFIVLAVVPDLARASRRWPGFAIGLLRIPGAGLLLLLFVFGLTLPVRGDHHAALLPAPPDRDPQHAARDRAAAHRAVHAVRRVLDARPLREHAAPRSPRPPRVDGATTWDLFWRIHVPLARAPIASLGILMSVWTWNQFLLALVLVEDPTQRTMAGALGAFQGHYATDIPLLCAGTILILLPDAHRVHALPAPGHHGAAPGLGEGVTMQRPSCATPRSCSPIRTRSAATSRRSAGCSTGRSTGCSAASTCCRRSRRPATAGSRR